MRQQFTIVTKRAGLLDTFAENALNYQKNSRFMAQVELSTLLQTPHRSRSYRHNPHGQLHNPNGEVYRRSRQADGRNTFGGRKRDK
jgi:hypothetical protein